MDQKIIRLGAISIDKNAAIRWDTLILFIQMCEFKAQPAHHQDAFVPEIRFTCKFPRIQKYRHRVILARGNKIKVKAAHRSRSGCLYLHFYSTYTYHLRSARQAGRNLTLLWLMVEAVLLAELLSSSTGMALPNNYNRIYDHRPSTADKTERELCREERSFLKTDCGC